jgi:hypothetical protein
LDQGVADMRDGFMLRDSVDLYQMRQGTVAQSDGHRTTDVLDLMATRAQGDQALERLDTLIVVVVPNLMALDWMSAAFAPANLALVTCLLIAGFPQAVPFARFEARAQVIAP